MNTRCSWFVSKIIFLAATIFFSAASHSCVNDKRKDADSASSYASLDSSTGYVGMETCRQCHAANYDSYIRTGMGRSFGLANHQKSAAEFPKKAAVYDAASDFWYYPHWESDQLKFTELRLSGRDTLHKRTQSINYIVGSGQHTNSHLYQVNGYLFQAPMTFYTQEKRWDLPPGFENGHNSRFGRKIEFECITCHNAYPETVTGSENKYTKIPLGIDCERCHGPGAKHVALKRQGVFIDTSKAIDYSIVNPAKLPINLQLDVCQRCHIQGNSVLKPGKTFFDFKPGMNLSSVMDVYMPVFAGNEDEHIMASHAERMKMSRCFLESKKLADKKGEGEASLKPYKNAMTCVTCHNPHVSVKETGKEVYNNACVSCHSPAKNQLVCTAPVAIRKSKGDNCSGCHMPKNNTIDIPHVVTTDHYIRKPVSVKQKEAIRKFVRLASINNSQPSRYSKGVAYLNYFEKFVSKKEYLDSARIYLHPAHDSEFVVNYHALVRLAYLSANYAEVIQLEQRMHQLNFQPAGTLQEKAWTRYRIGESLQQLNNLSRAVECFKDAVVLLPYQLDFRLKLADALYNVNDIEGALNTYRFVLKEQPENTKALLNYGFIMLAEKGDVKLADSVYSKVLELDPDYVQALINKTGTMVMTGQYKQGEAFLNRALKLDPGNIQAKRMKKAISDERGR